MRTVPSKPNADAEMPAACVELSRISCSGLWLRRVGRLKRWLGVLAGGIGLSMAPLSACSTLPGTQRVSMASLERAATVQPSRMERWMIADPNALAPVSRSLSPRFALVELRSERDWRHFEAALGPLRSPDSTTHGDDGTGDERSHVRAPDFSRGIMIGIISRLGTPVDALWPIQVEAIRNADGAGLVSAHFAPGNYLPNQAAYASTAYVEGVWGIVAVEINGDRFYPAP